MVRQYLHEFMERPSCVFQKPDVLRAVLGCLPFEDLQMVLAYVVRQHGDAMSGTGEAGALRAKHGCLVVICAAEVASFSVSKQC